MATEIKPIPDGFHAITPHLVVRDASAAIEFYKKAFGAHELHRSTGPDGKSGSATDRSRSAARR